LSPLNFAFNILLHIVHTHRELIRSHILFSIDIKGGILHLKDLFLECDPYLLVTSIFFNTFYYEFFLVI
jgi:hypothetical protein